MGRQEIDGSGIKGGVSHHLQKLLQGIAFGYKYLTKITQLVALQRDLSTRIAQPGLVRDDLAKTAVSLHIFKIQNPWLSRFMDERSDMVYEAKIFQLFKRTELLEIQP